MSVIGWKVLLIWYCFWPNMLLIWQCYWQKVLLMWNCFLTKTCSWCETVFDQKVLLICQFLIKRYSCYDTVFDQEVLLIWHCFWPNSTLDMTLFMTRMCSNDMKLFHQKSGLGGSVGCAVRLETRRSQIQSPPRSATFFRGDWSWNIFYGHSLPSADSRRAVVSFWRKNVHNTG